MNHFLLVFPRLALQLSRAVKTSLRESLALWFALLLLAKTQRQRGNKNLNLRQRYMPSFASNSFPYLCMINIVCMGLLLTFLSNIYFSEFPHLTLNWRRRRKRPEVCMVLMSRRVKVTKRLITTCERASVFRASYMLISACSRADCRGMSRLQ